MAASGETANMPSEQEKHEFRNITQEEEEDLEDLELALANMTVEGNSMSVFIKGVTVV